MSEPLLQVSRLNKRFGALQATREVDLAVTEGQIHALIGPNGAGKTTLVSQLAGELASDSGTIRFAGRDITRLPVHSRARAGLVRSYQIVSIFAEFSVLDNVALAVQARLGPGLWRNARRDARLLQPARQWLEQMGLMDQAHLPAGELAHGEQRQLEVAMALACEPKLLLLDEPMAGIGPGGTRELTRRLAALKGRVTLLLVEHDMDVVFALADRITVLAYGQVIASGSPDQIRRDPQVRQAYLGEED